MGLGSLASTSTCSPQALPCRLRAQHCTQYSRVLCGTAASECTELLGAAGASHQVRGDTTNLATTQRRQQSVTKHQWQHACMVQQGLRVHTSGSKPTAISIQCWLLFLVIHAAAKARPLPKTAGQQRPPTCLAKKGIVATGCRPQA